MKFPTKTCIPTTDLTYKTYSAFICKLVSQGYENNISHLSFSLMTNWDYIGVTEYGSIECYDQPSSFLGINEWIKYTHLKDEDFPNVWPKSKLDQYLGGLVV
jgi:hypothetical protein